MTQQLIIPRKSPLHPSALRLNDLTVGRRIIKYNRVLGIIFEGVVLSRPYGGYLFPWVEPVGNERRHHIVRLRSRLGTTSIEVLADMGVVPYADYGWNSVNFTIDARKRHLLPAPVLNLRDNWIEDRWGLEEEEEFAYEY